MSGSGWHRPPSLGSEGTVADVFGRHSPKLDLSNFSLADPVILNAVATALRTDRSCQELRLTGCGVGAGAAALFDAINANPHGALRALNLRGNGLGPARQAGAIGTFLAHNTSVQRIDIAANALAEDEEGFTSLFLGLKSAWAGLRFMDACSNGIQTLPFAAVEEALTALPYLFINFNSNPVISKADMARITALLKARHQVVSEMLSAATSVAGSTHRSTPPGAKAAPAATAPAPAPAATVAAAAPAPPAGAKPGPVCDNCHNPVVEFQYRCVQCARFRLCMDCYYKHNQKPLHDAEHSFMGMDVPPPKSAATTPAPAPAPVPVEAEAVAGKQKEVVCGQCGAVGHRAADCSQLPTSSGREAAVKVATESREDEEEEEIRTEEVTPKADRRPLVEAETVVSERSPAAASPPPASQPMAVEAPSLTTVKQPESKPPDTVPVARPMPVPVKQTSPLIADIQKMMANLDKGGDSDEDDAPARRPRLKPAQPAPRSRSEPPKPGGSPARARAAPPRDEPRAPPSPSPRRPAAPPERRRSASAHRPVAPAAAPGAHQAWPPDRDERSLGRLPGTHALPRVPLTYLADDLRTIHETAKKAASRASPPFLDPRPRTNLEQLGLGPRLGPGVYTPNLDKLPLFDRAPTRRNRPPGFNTRGRPIWGLT